MVRRSTDLPAPEAPTKPRISPRIDIERQLVENDLVAEGDRDVARRQHDLAGRPFAAPLPSCLSQRHVHRRHQKSIAA